MGIKVFFRLFKKTLIADLISIWHPIWNEWHQNLNFQQFLFIHFCEARLERTIHGLRTPGEEIVFTARPKINSHSQIFRYGRSIFCLSHRPKFSDLLGLCIFWVSVVRGTDAMMQTFSFLDFYQKMRFIENAIWGFDFPRLAEFARKIWLLKTKLLYLSLTVSCFFCKMIWKNFWGNE